MASGHDHVHGSSRARLAVTLAITSFVLAAEVVGAVWTGSLALLVDAGHMLTDSLGLAIALVAATLMARPASARRTWGWMRAEVIAAAAQASVLLAVSGYAMVEAVRRLFDPPEMAADGLAFFGVVGLLANLASLLVLTGGRDRNLNMRAAFLEVANDALGSVAVLLAAGAIALTGWTPADTVAGLLIAALIVPRAVLLLRDSGRILLESTPVGLDLERVRDHMLRRPEVLGVHDLHASTISSGLPTLSAHVVLEDACFAEGRDQTVLEALLECAASHHAVTLEHCTLQLETAAVARRHQEHLHR